MTEPRLSPIDAAAAPPAHGHVRLRRRPSSPGDDLDAAAPDRAHEARHDHDHDHDHDHGHSHGHEHPAVAARPAPSLIRASLAARLVLALALSGLIWAGVAWARLPIAG